MVAGQEVLGGASPLPGRTDAETFSFLLFPKSDSLLLRNSSEMRDDLTCNLLTLPLTN